MELKEKVKEVYEKYGFRFHEEVGGVLSFLLVAGVFRNIEVVAFDTDIDLGCIESEYREAGYNVSVFEFCSFEGLEERLFSAFFNVIDYRSKVSGYYDDFSRGISRKTNSESYNYLSAPYKVNGRVGGDDVISEIVSRLSGERPAMFIVEAAAGYGKTCTAYEVMREVNKCSEKIPLLAELYKNRQAKIFRYVLLDEIERSFYGVNSAAVASEIASGRIVTILDGFDELLKESEVDDSFDTSEPMLETIGEFLRGRAKVILTTRKTMLFDGDSFHSWVAENEQSFDVVRIEICEPQVRDWIGADRQRKLSDSGIDIHAIANPVLLSFLRSISDEDFDEVCSAPENIMDRYLSAMLAREQDRQDLLMNNEQQHQILDVVVDDMLRRGYTQISRSDLVGLILDDSAGLLQDAMAVYRDLGKSVTMEELANKLASHAFFDRSAKNPNKIGFINDLVLGYFVTRNVLSSQVEWLCDDWRFIEPSIMLYRTRSQAQKDLFWDKLSPSFDYWSASHRVFCSLALKGMVCFDIKGGEVNAVTFRGIDFSGIELVKSMFSDCVFSDCNFAATKMRDVTFMNCKFYSCSSSGAAEATAVHFLACEIVGEGFEEGFKSSGADPVPVLGALERAERAVLERFWLVGKNTMTHRHRPIRGICTPSEQGELNPEDMYNAIQSLQRKGLLGPGRSSICVEVNTRKMKEIMQILGRA